METYENEFTNGEITVIFEPKKCMNSGICAKGLSEVFKTMVIPWIDMDGANTDHIKSQVRKCPSGALSCHLTKDLVTVK